MKVTIVGAGAVGATCADNITRKNIAEEVILIDIKEGLSEGKAQDIMQSAALFGFNTKIKGVTNNYEATKNSDIAVITSGIPRKPGMTREELIGTNAKIVEGVCHQILTYSPNVIFIIVSNPMDTMNYLTLQSTKLPKNRVIGMGGLLDSSRFVYQICQTLCNMKHPNCNPSAINAWVIGGHGDTTMIPLIRLATVNDQLILPLLSSEQQQKIVNDTMVGGATLTKLIGTSAWYAPGAAVATMVEAILKDTNKIVPCSVYLDGEYGQKDICLGVPVTLGKNGWSHTSPIDLNEAEKENFTKSAEAVRTMNNVLKEVVPGFAK